jgi:ring-1,2-phenylacetyl-CoA epoxidase subunit PaaC
MENNSSLVDYCLRVGDTSLILSQRLGEWCGHGPILEEDIALTNIALDLLGQARTFLTYAGQTEGKGRSEDDLAYFRGEREYRNFLMVEQPNGDFGQTMLRQFFVSTFQYYFFGKLIESKDNTLAALAEKSLKEVTYHLRHSSEWIKRLGGGTEESKQRMMNAFDALWLYTEEMFDESENDKKLVKAGIAVNLQDVKILWNQKVKDVFQHATLVFPENSFMIHGSREGKHTEFLGHMLAEMQSLPRAFPGAQW